MATYKFDKIEYNGNTYVVSDSEALPLTGGQVTGPVTFGDTVSIDEATVGDLVVNGSASFTNNIQANTISGDLTGDVTGNVVGNVSGSAGTAGAFTSAKSVTLTGDVTGSASSTGGWSIATTVKDDSHNHTASTLSGVALSTDVLTKTNTTSYTPSADYHPATKKYVDDAVSNVGCTPDWDEDDSTSSSYILNKPPIALGTGQLSIVEGYETTASGEGSHAEGQYTTASGDYSHAEGDGTIAYSDYSHAEGGSDNSSTSLILTGEANATTYITTSSTTYSPELLIGCKIGSSIITDITYSEKTLSSIVVDKTLSTSAISNKTYTISGIYTTAKSITSHAEGGGTKTSGDYSHAEGWRAYASGFASHAEGGGTIAYGEYSHAEGQWTVANGKYSHAEGKATTASGQDSHAEGNGTTAQRRSQHVFGEFNILDTGGSSVSTKGTYIEIVGKGTSNFARSNARTLDWSGNETLAGSITLGKGTSDEVTLTPAQLKQLLALL